MSTLKRVTAPASNPVSLDEAKKQLRVDSADEDELIEGFISSATEYSEKFQGRSLMDQTWDYYLDAFPVGCIEIPRPPAIEVIGVFYIDSNGDEQQFESFEVDLVSEPARLFLPSSGSWPTPADRLNAVRIRYRAGYLDSSSPPVANVPHATIQAIRQIIGTMYAQRETLVVGQTVAIVPWGADQLLRQNKIEIAFA